MDLRKQKQEQMITTVGGCSLWSISIDKKALFNEVSTRSLYFVNNSGQMSNDSNVILDDDKGMYDLYAEKAVQELIVLLSRRIPQDVECYGELYGDTMPLMNDSTVFEANLLMSANHDRNLIAPLRVSCKEFLVRRILELWYGADFSSFAEKDSIVHIMQYRRKSVARRVRPLL